MISLIAYISGPGEPQPWKPESYGSFRAIISCQTFFIVLYPLNSVKSRMSYKISLKPPTMMVTWCTKFFMNCTLYLKIMIAPKPSSFVYSPVDVSINCDKKTMTDVQELQMISVKEEGSAVTHYGDY